MNFKLKIWRQRDAKSRGKLIDYEVRDISPDTSFLEMLDILNENLVGGGGEPVAFDSDCREGICGTCSLTVNGEAHGPDHPGAVCELYMRKFRDGEKITIEPFRVGAFPIVKDLVVDRSSLDRVVQAGGFISARAGSAERVARCRRRAFDRRDRRALRRSLRRPVSFSPRSAPIRARRA